MTHFGKFKIVSKIEKNERRWEENDVLSAFRLLYTLICNLQICFWLHYFVFCLKCSEIKFHHPSLSQNSQTLSTNSYYNATHAFRN